MNNNKHKKSYKLQHIVYILLSINILISIFGGPSTLAASLTSFDFASRGSNTQTREELQITLEGQMAHYLDKLAKWIEIAYSPSEFNTQNTTYPGSSVMSLGMRGLHYAKMANSVIEDTVIKLQNELARIESSLRLGETQFNGVKTMPI